MIIDNNKQVLRILEIEEKFKNRFFAPNCLCYYSPFTDVDDFENYSYHVLAFIEEPPSSIEESAIGNYIAPEEPYYLVENDIIVEFQNSKINAYKVTKKENQLSLDKFCKNAEDNIFIANFIKLKLV